MQAVVKSPCWTFVAQFKVCLYMVIYLFILQPCRLLWQHQNIDRAGTLWLRVKDRAVQYRHSVRLFLCSTLASFEEFRQTCHFCGVHKQDGREAALQSPVLSAQQQTIYSLLHSVALRSVSAPCVCTPSFRFMTELNWGQVQN